MPIEALDWASAPADTDAVDGPTNFYTMGPQFNVSEDTPCPGLRWRVPDTVPDPPGGHFASLWEVSPDLRVRHQAITPTPGGDQDFLWDSGPITLEAAKTYIVQVFTHHYVARTSDQGATFPVSTPSGIASASVGKLGTAGVDGIASSNFTTYYYVSPLIGEDDGPPAVTGSGELALPPLAMAGAGSISLIVGAGTLPLPPLVLAGTGGIENPDDPGGPSGPVAVDPLNAVQKAVFDAAKADAQLMALLPGGVHDEPPEGEERDYLVLGDHLSLPDNTHDKFGREITQTFHIWTKSRGTKRGQDIAARWNALFDHQVGALSVPGHRIVIVRNEFQQALRDPDPQWRQTLIRYRVFTEQL